MSGSLHLPEIRDSDPTPRYLQAEQILADAIYSGQIAPGSKIPSTQEIANQIKVSLITAHKALERLVRAGLLRREVGRGTFVCDDPADALEAQKQLSIGLMIDTRVNVDDYYHASIIDGLRQAASSDSRRVEFFFQDFASLNRARARGVSGLICFHPAEELHSAVARYSENTALVVLGGTLPESNIAFVDCDNFEGARSAIRHLQGLGHTRIAVLTGPTDLSNSRDRCDGARKELAVRNVALDEQMVLESADSVTLDDATQTRLAALLKRNDRPTAVFCGGFYLALTALQTARQAGLRVPEDISLVGFDDPPSAPLLDPPMTTVRQPLHEMASRAYYALRNAIERNDRQAFSLELPTKLIVRGSTAPLG